MPLVALTTKLVAVVTIPLRRKRTLAQLTGAEEPAEIVVEESSETRRKFDDLEDVEVAGNDATESLAAEELQ